MEQIFRVGEIIPIIKSNWPYIKISPFGVLQKQKVTRIMSLNILGTNEYYFVYEFNNSGVFYDLKPSRRTDGCGNRGYKKKRIVMKLKNFRYIL